MEPRDRVKPRKTSSRGHAVLRGGPRKSLSFHAASCGGVCTAHLRVGAGLFDEAEHGIRQGAGIIIGDDIPDTPKGIGSN